MSQLPITVCQLDLDVVDNSDEGFRPDNVTMICFSSLLSMGLLAQMRGLDAGFKCVQGMYRPASHSRLCVSQTIVWLPSSGVSLSTGEWLL
jgi:hypothetical protein